jgi:rhodanese-related sulfurtransferase
MKTPHLLFITLLTFVLFHSIPVTAETFKEITAPEVKDMIEEGNVVVVHVLSEIEYGIQHIPDSINIPIVKMKTTDKLPQDLETPLVFYCMGER